MLNGHACICKNTTNYNSYFTLLPNMCQKEICQTNMAYMPNMCCPYIGNLYTTICHIVIT